MPDFDIILTEKAPKPIGPYSQAVRTSGDSGGQSSGLVFCSGQIPLDSATGQLVEGDVQAQTRKVMENMAAVLEAAGSGLQKVLKTTIFLKSMNDFPKVNEVYGSFFTKNPPARSTVEVSRLPKDVLVEIECIALGK